MAASTQYRTRRYSTYGNVAYQPEPELDRQALGRPRREPERTARPRVQPRTRTVSRPQVEVRRQSAVSLFTILGFAAVAVCALLLVMTSAQLAMVNDEAVELRATLSDLQDEEKTLQAQYELAFDLTQIQQQLTADGSMVKASPSQTIYLDLSEADSVVYYDAAQGGLSGLLRQAQEFLSGFLA